MAQNIEIKARVHDIARAHRLASALSDRPVESLSQRDIFFRTEGGRLKLRWQGDGRAYLVYYERADDAGPRSSVYHVAESQDPASLEEVLSAALGVRGEVRKHRTIYMVGTTRIHLDRVHGLGHFLELEAVLGPQQTLAQAYAMVASLMDQLAISDSDLIDVAYIDLLERNNRMKEDSEPYLDAALQRPALGRPHMSAGPTQARMDPQEKPMNRDQMLELLSELITCHSPAGEEREIDVVLRREFEATGAQVWQDGATNLYAHLPGPGTRVMVCAHKDEIGMAVTSLKEDGRLGVENCGGARPWKYGEGPVDVIADDGSIVRGILSVGSVHTKSGPVPELDRDRALTWDLMTIFTGLDGERLAAQGVHVGSRAVVARERKQLQHLGSYIASFALDDRMGLVSLITALRVLAERGTVDTAPDLTFVATHGEEIGMLGAVRAARAIQPEVCVALDTSPVAHGTPLSLDARPVVWYRERAYHNKDECDKLLRLAAELGFGAQACLYEASGSDAGRIKEAGLADRTVCFGFARDNSHGYEIAHVDAIVNVTRLLVTYLEGLA